MIFVVLATTIIAPRPIRASTPVEKATIIDEEMTFESCSAAVATYQTPITTFSDCIYTVYLDPNRHICIAKKSRETVTTKDVNGTAVANDRYHMAPSIGIDNDGYIHVTGGMHGADQWLYWVSDRPEDITAFTYKGDAKQSPPGRHITYPRFYNDRNGTLYVSFRHSVDDELYRKWTHGCQGGGLAKYDCGSKTWTQLGGTSYPRGLKYEKSLFWTDKDSGDGYEPGIMYVYFDTKNRMHVAYMMQDQYNSSGGGYNGFYLVYACSADGGATFYRADGTQYATLPITHNRGDAIVGPSFTHTEGARYGLYSEAIGIGRGGDGKIMVTFAQRKKGGTAVYYSKYDKGWTAPVATTLGPYIPIFLSDSDGRLTGYKSTRGTYVLKRSLDSGETWQDYPIAPCSDLMFDWRYGYATGNFRYQVFTPDRKVKVYTAVFSAN